MSAYIPLSGDPALDRRVHEALLARGLTIATAESSTGGLLLARLTALSGSSAYVIGGVVAYADQVKQAVLGVQADTLAAYGAVSELVARQMAEGVRRLLGTDLALSVTGIAGPTGATALKPVGLHYIGLATSDGARVWRHVWESDRAGNRQASADEALRMLLAHLEETAP